MEKQFKPKPLILQNVAPLDLGRCCTCGQAFRWQPGGNGAFFGVVRGRGVLAEQRGDSLVLHGAAQEDAAMWADYFDLGRDYGAIEELIAQDMHLAQCLPAARGIRVFNQEPFEALISFIISANNNIKRISGIVERLCRLAGRDVGGYFCFPTAEAIAALSVEQLKDIGAGYRAPYIRASAGLVAGGYQLELLRGLPLEQARRELRAFPGVGPKVADCILLFSLGHTGAFPMDVWMGRAMRELFFNGEEPTKQELDAVICRLGKYSGLVQQYIFHFARENGVGIKV